MDWEAPVLRIVIILAAIVLIVHGLMHLMGTAVYMRLAEIKGLAYKTTLLGGRWDLGEGGILVFGALRVLPAIGFVAAALALLAGWRWWEPVLLGATLWSLALASLDWNGAFTGVIVDIAILAVLWLVPPLVGSFS